MVGWASAVLDSHFTRLAIGGAANSDLVGALKVLKKTARREAECCELLCQVRGLWGLRKFVVRGESGDVGEPGTGGDEARGPSPRNVLIIEG